MGDGRGVFSLLGWKRYFGDRNDMSSKVCEGGGGSGTEYKSGGLCALVGGDSRRYYEQRTRTTEIFFGTDEEGAGVRCAAGLGGTSFSGKSSCGERVAAGTKICVQGILSVEVFAHRVGVAGGGGRRYCGESVGALVCVFGVVGEDGLAGGSF